ncbi:hypothetical protein RhiJN_22988 [Ceratobasidium sp. AG-Ba]|nr:hypothetical protein RhiJN_22988 [Ceratobasidium sp. AG-Ba]
MAESWAPQTPPTRPHFLQRHHRMDSFPTDNTSELSLSFDEGDTPGSGCGMPESISLGALPMFLLQEGNRKSFPQFPESPESTYGFAPPMSRTVASPPPRLQLLGNISGGVTGFESHRQRHSSSDSWDSQLSTPIRPPSFETPLLSSKPSFLSEEDETLVGHGATPPNKRTLRPVMSFSSATSTVLASPLSDVFSPGPGSASCSISTATSGSSRRSPCLDEFPTEVGGMASLDLEEPDRILLTSLPEESASSISLTVDADPYIQPALEIDSSLPVHTPARVYPAKPHTPKSSISSVPCSPVGTTHRRAFSGARELFAPSSSNGTSASGRLRSSSVNSGPRDLIEQAARSRSASVSAGASLAPSMHGAARSLNSMQSKESFRTKFAHLPGYVTFLREITLEIWIDQEGFRAIRPQFELHRYTPGQLAPITPGLRISASPKSPKTVRPRTAQLPMSSPRKAGEESRRPSTSGSAPVAAELSRQQFLENWGLAEFTMSKRKGWHFHHGVAEADPMLRRLTINGVEDRDYLSREASLSVRTNGVYTVRGTEDHGRFSWKFEYLVEDRRGQSGAIISGEKTLVPLSFSCSPELLIPEQGKKVGLLRVMKKSVTPKISSAKMDPVLLPSASTSSVDKDKSKKFDTFSKIVRPKSFKSPRRLVASVGSRRAVDRSEDVTENGHRRASSFSNMRPDLKQILGDGLY